MRQKARWQVLWCTLMWLGLFRATETQAADSVVRQTHVVLPLANASENEEYRLMGAAIADLLSAYLSSRPDVVVLDRAHIDKVLAEQNMALSGDFATDRGIILQHIMGVTTIHAGSFTIKGQELGVVLRSFDVATSQIQRSIDEMGMISALDLVCMHLAERLTEPVPSERRSLSTYRVDVSPKANVHYARGLAFYWSNNCAAAVKEFLRVLLLDPGKEDVRYWLGKSYFCDGHWLSSRLEFDRFMKEHPSHPLVSETRQLLQNCVRNMDAREKAILADQTNSLPRQVNGRFWDER